MKAVILAGNQAIKEVLKQELGNMEICVFILVL